MSVESRVHPGVDAAPQRVVIQPQRHVLDLDLASLWSYRELFFFMVWRDVKARYAQSVLGIGWAVIQPVFSMVVFTVVFGGLAGIDSEGVPYELFSFAALVPWTYFASSLTDATGSLVKNSNMLQKIYFPRLILPMASVLGKLVDFSIAFCLLGGLMLAFGVAPNTGAFALPLLILIMMIAAMGLGMWMSALAVQYRDVSYGVAFAIQLLMYATPVVYPASLVVEKLGSRDYVLWIYALNPMVGVIEGFRSALLGTVPMPWDLIAIGGGAALFLLLTGVIYFRKRERVFADVV